MTEVLRHILAPLARHYDDPAVIEVRMSAPKKLVLDIRGQGLVQVRDEALSLHAVETITRSLANANGLTFHEEKNPKVSLTLPDKHRFECLIGRSAIAGLSLAIRCKHPFSPTWQEMGITGELFDYVKQLIALNKNLLISGATNTGKTTFLNKLLSLLPDSKRVVTVEDTPELEVERFWNGQSLIAAREEGTGAGLLSYRQIYDHLMRITPDNIIFGEISTQNAFPAMGALNSGVTGFMCTIHAESPQQAIHRKFEQNTAWSGQDMPRVSEFMCEMIDAVIQIKRDSTGYRRITDIWEPQTDTMVFQDGKPTPAMAQALIRDHAA